MHRRSVLYLVAVAAMLSALVLAGCAPQATPTPQVVVKKETVVVEQTKVIEKAVPAPAGKPIRIAVPIEQTGPRAYPGQAVCRASKLAGEVLNAQGGILGRPVVVDCIDDQSDPKQAVVVAHAICDNPDYVAVWGHGTSGTTIPAEPIYDECRIPLLAQGSNPNVTKQGFNNVFQAVPNDLAQGRAAAEYLKELGVKTVSVTQNKTIFGETLAGVFKDRAEQLGIKVLSLQGINPEDVDFTPTLTKIKLENPDAIYHAGYVVESAPLRKQMVALGMKQLFVASESTTSEFVATTGDAGIGAISSTAAIGYDASDALKQFAQAYEKSWGLPPEPFCNYYYDAIFIIADAVKRAGTTEHEAVISALRTTDYQGITMRYAFDAEGRLKNPVAFVFELKTGGKWELVKSWVGTYE